MNERSNTSDVTVTYIDGEVKTYRISAGPGVAQYLNRESASTGFLLLLNGNIAHSIPIVQIKEWTIEGWPNHG